ncbi:hypothetical protein [Pseudovibrio sp. Tun.PSC04-5.I4]|uniref:hypothetical protein n=1 Tax=Pseudovibrio sp. Tun.PSC04-5.I4 TaxID=1798213 RepID=UPI00088046A3|nr:hypothetical protein [Pseudovibrio sp. Tun.PSC04-5.I4]SDR19751.1 hypothetical protein SAMN04515695_3339 [Pseudovibrio sp. Tun.PSC04-5.I4]
MTAALSFLIGTRAGRAIAAALLLIALAVIVYHQIRQGAFDDAEQATLKQTVKVEQERKRDDGHLQDLDDYNLCREYLGDRSVPDGECEQLRGLH